ncbi:DUF3761 domain-containing protein [Streptomyces sp. NPDC048111]|uniref:DUF3761 domain-containing protein n=1 Tax=Streptomyces sp. NPDC048111 TaxID=3365500 RepID=UPI003710AC70
MAPPQRRPRPTARDQRNALVGCGILLAALLGIGGCGALINGGGGGGPAPASTGASAAIAVKSYVGMGLQAAQDAAQSDGISKLASTDATGRHRSQLWDRNWTVCAQTPAAGTTMTAADTLRFDTVKSSEGETCTASTPAGSPSAATPTPTATATGSPGGDGTNSASSDGSSRRPAAGSGTSAGAGGHRDTTGSSPSTGRSGSTPSTGHSSSSTSSTGGSGHSSTGGSTTSGGSSSSGSQHAPSGATAQCVDGTYSYSAHRRGTCSHHGGVARWLADLPS